MRPRRRRRTTSSGSPISVWIWANRCVLPRLAELDLLLDELGVTRVLLAGAATEGCVAQTGVQARELGLKVTLLAFACFTVDEEREQVALRYAETVAGIRIASTPEEHARQLLHGAEAGG